MVQPEKICNRLLTVIAVILVVAALQWSYPVTMPLVVAIFIIAAAWPIKPWLDQKLPSSLSYVGAVLALFLILAGFIAVIYIAIAQVVQTFGQNQEQFRAVYETYATWARDKGVPTLGGEGGYDRLVAIAQVLFWRIYTMLGYFGFIAVLVIIGLPEVPALARKFRDQLRTGENSGTGRRGRADRREVPPVYRDDDAPQPDHRRCVGHCGPLPLALIWR